MINAQYFIEKYLSKIPGWCSKDKAEKFVELINKTNAQLCVEIGVFGGSSLFPQALAMKDKGSGLVIGIDPWTKDSALEDMVNQANKDWWGALNLQNIYEMCLQNIENYQIQNFCNLVRKKSSEVVDQFGDNSVDILHIDGNHCERLAYEDCVNYFPKVKAGGYIFFDDTTWVEQGNVASTQKGYLYLKESCDEICIVNKDCAVLQKR